MESQFQLITQRQMTQVVNILKDFRHLYNGYRYFITGSIARNENNPNDIDVNILPTLNNFKEWEEILNNFKNKEVNGLKIDAQIIPKLNKIMNGYKGEVDKYIYKDGKLSKKKANVANDKACKRGVDKIPFAYMEL